MNALRALIFFLASYCSLLAVEPGFTPLLDRNNTDGWKQCGEYGWEIRDGIAITGRPKGSKGISTMWYSKGVFGDFLLRLEYKGAASEFNSGIHLRFPYPGNDNEVVRSKGNEVAITHNSSEDAPSGSIYYFRKAAKEAQRAGDWNEMEIAAVGRGLCVRINGTLVCQHVLFQSGSGYIGIQNHPLGAVQFRNVRVRELSAAANPEAALDSSVLALALTSRPWSWTTPTSVTQLEFKSDGTVVNSQRQISQWRALDACTLQVTSKSGPSLQFVFDKNFTHYVQAGEYESPIAGMAMELDPLCGTWRWFDNAIRVFFPDGTLGDRSGKRYGNWACKNPDAAPGADRHYKIEYDGGKFTDHLALVKGYTFLDGLNNFRLHVTANRLAE